MFPDSTLLLSFDDASAGSSFTSMLPMLAAMGLIFYFVLYRPQKQEADTQAKLIAALQKGDRVVTSSGIHGRIHEALGDTLVIEISPKNYLTVDRDAVRRRLDDTAKAEPQKADAAKGN